MSDNKPWPTTRYVRRMQEKREARQEKQADKSARRTLEKPQEFPTSMGIKTAETCDCKVRHWTWSCPSQTYALSVCYKMDMILKDITLRTIFRNPHSSASLAIRQEIIYKLVRSHFPRDDAESFAKLWTTCNGSSQWVLAGIGNVRSASKELLGSRATFELMKEFN